ncbi:uncharacterized protein N7503_007207 [Penicillium pulvis]|uniref:uncharacterized protein n=1 Tax=Penicillium pulvis TaxID=1562058 RepID=UPI002548800B|nr:uncharacterized protein N7503_007207 [Penicillium pulvis]KAJ5797911.1 hypothetical protein N7503_007207 [Penicillium pulvis]
MKMDLTGMGSWAANAPTFPSGADFLSDLSGLSGSSRNATTFPDTRPASGSSASLEAYLNAPRSSQPWSPANRR